MSASELRAAIEATTPVLVLVPIIMLIGNLLYGGFRPVSAKAPATSQYSHHNPSHCRRSPQAHPQNRGAAIELLRVLQIGHVRADSHVDMSESG
jgi:hypothetical protein